MHGVFTGLHKTIPIVTAMVARSVETNAKQSLIAKRLLKACHSLIIKLYQIDYLGLFDWKLTAGFTIKFRILDKIENLLTKMSCGV
jgi:hypothetical protein